MNLRAHQPGSRERDDNFAAGIAYCDSLPPLDSPGKRRRR